MSELNLLPPTVDRQILMDAIAAQETAGGVNNCPRFEVSYMPTGFACTVQGRILRGTGANWNPIVQARWEKWGLASAASYGAHQVLYHTAADLGFDKHPALLWVEPDTCRQAVIARLNQIAAKGAQTVEQFADAWNSGSFRDRFEPKDYMRELRAHYDRLAAGG